MKLAIRIQSFLGLWIPFLFTVVSIAPASKLVGQQVERQTRSATLSEIETLWSKAQSAAEKGDSRTAARLGVMAYQRAEKLPPDDHAMAADFAFQISNWYMLNDDAKSGRDYAERHLAFVKSSQGEDKHTVKQAEWHLNWATRLAAAKPEKFTALMDVQRKFDEAVRANKSPELRLELAKQFIPLEKEILGEFHPNFANTLSSVATIEFELQNHSFAVRSGREALRIYCEKYGDNNSVTANWAFLLGQLERANKEHERSLETLKAAKEAFEQLRRPNDVAACNLEIGKTLTWLDQWDDANIFFHRAYVTYKREKDFQGLVESLKSIRQIVGDVKPASQREFGAVATLYGGTFTRIGQAFPRLPCLLDARVRPFFRGAISDWENACLNMYRCGWLRDSGNLQQGLSELTANCEQLEKAGFCGTIIYASQLSRFLSSSIKNLLKLESRERITQIEAQQITEAATILAADYVILGNPLSSSDVLVVCAGELWKAGHTTQAVELLELQNQCLEVFFDIEAASAEDQGRYFGVRHLLASKLFRFGAFSQARELAIDTLGNSQINAYPAQKAFIESLLVQILTGDQAQDFSNRSFQTALICKGIVEECVERTTNLPEAEDSFTSSMLFNINALGLFFSDPNQPLAIKASRIREYDELLMKCLRRIEELRPTWAYTLKQVSTVRQQIWSGTLCQANSEWAMAGVKPQQYDELAKNAPDLVSEDPMFQLARRLRMALLDPETAENWREFLGAVTLLRQDPNLELDPFLHISLPQAEFLCKAWLSEDLKTSFELIDLACERVESLSMRVGGAANVQLQSIAKLRSIVDPFSTGQLIATSEKDTRLAFKYALRGRGLASRVLLGSLTDQSPHGRLFPVERDINDFYGTAESQADLLNDKEKLLLISTLSTIGPVNNTSTYLLGKLHGDKDVMSFTSNRLASCDLKSGVLIDFVAPNSAAASAGLAPLDVITHLGGESVDFETFTQLVGKLKGLENVKIDYIRNGDSSSTAASFSQLLGVSVRNPTNAWNRLAYKNAKDIRDATDNVVRSEGRVSNRSNSSRKESTPQAVAEPVEAVSYKLFRSIFPEELWKQVRYCDRVYVSLPPEMSGLPLESLIVEPPVFGQRRHVRWIDVGPQVIYLPAGRLTKRWTEREDQRGDQISLTAIGEVDFSSFEGFEPLPGTKSEVESAQKSVGQHQATVLQGSNATESNLLESALDSRFILICTHGDPRFGDEVLQSALLLTPSDASDGRLTLSEVLTHWRDRLGSADTVILSSCQSNRGLLVHDEAALAMPFGMLMAGAESVIASQWPVDDAATAELFSEYFRQISLGKSSLDAFTIARKHVRAIDKFADPYFWAPFIFISQ